MAAITVVIADRQRARRVACRRLLKPARGIRVLAETPNGLGAIAAAGLRPRVLLLDSKLSRHQGASLLGAIRRRSPRTRVILLTERDSEALLLDALGRGAPGYLEKKSVSAFLTRAIRVVAAGEAWVPRRMVSKIVDQLRVLKGAGGNDGEELSDIRLR